jgi:hypothetical protein
MKEEPIATTFKCFVKGATRYINNDDVDVSHALVRQLHGFMEMMEREMIGTLHYNYNVKIPPNLTIL